MITTNLQIESKKAFVPKLRFKEFKGEWELIKLGSYIKLYIERVLATTEIPILTSSRNGLYKQSDYFNNREVTNTGEYGVVPMGYFTYRHMSDDSTFKFNINTKWEKGAVSKEYPVFTTVNMDKVFLHHKLNYGNELKKFAIAQKLGGTRVRLYFKKLRELKFRTPSLSEQTKIASFLTIIDEKLQVLNQKKTLLEQYKKCIMRRIFSQELRFKDDNGNDFSDWQDMKLGDVGEIYQPKTITQSELTKEGFDVYGANGIIGKYHSFNHEFSQIAITCRGNTCGTVNFTKPMSWITGNAMVLNLDKNNNAIKMFVFYELVNTNFTYLISGSGQPQITGNIREHNFLLPSLDEQTKIANFLLAIDDKIKTVYQQIDQTQSFKKGLLQQMFV